MTVIYLKNKNTVPIMAYQKWSLKMSYVQPLNLIIVFFFFYQSYFSLLVTGLTKN